MAQKIRARVAVVLLECDKFETDYSRVAGHLVFLDDMTVDDEYVGRPADIEVLLDGSMLISEDHFNNILVERYGAGFGVVRERDERNGGGGW